MPQITRAQAEDYVERLRKDYDCTACGGHLRALEHQSIYAAAQSSNFSSGHSMAICRLCRWSGPRHDVGLAGFKQAQDDAAAHNKEHGHPNRKPRLDHSGGAFSCPKTGVINQLVSNRALLAKHR